MSQFKWLESFLASRHNFVIVSQCMLSWQSLYADVCVSYGHVIVLWLYIILVVTVRLIYHVLKLCSVGELKMQDWNMWDCLKF